MSYRNRIVIGTALAVVAIGTSIDTRAYAVSLHTGLINYYRFNEGSGTTLTDTGPAGTTTDNGTLQSNPTWLTGAAAKFGAGMHFNGVDQYVQMPTGGDMDFGSPTGVTISAWLKLDELPAEMNETFGAVYDSTTDDYILYLDRGNDELRFKATVQSGTSTNAGQHPGVRSTELNKSDWVHVLGTLDINNARAEIYYNGQLTDFTQQTSANFFKGGTIRTGQIALLGAQANGVNPPIRFFAGGVSDFAIWNRPMGLAEAQYLYNGGVGNAVGAANPDIAPIITTVTPVNPTAQPVVYYKFDGNLNNSGTGGATYNANLIDAPGKNDTLFTSEATFGEGLDLRQNPVPITSLTPGNGDYLSIPYTMTDSGTIAMRYQINLNPVAANPEQPPGVYYNFATLWANSVQQDAWEAWMYNDGRIAARANNATNIVGAANEDRPDPVAPVHVAFAWERSTTDPTKMKVDMYVDGEYVDTRLGDWLAPGNTMFIAGGGTATTHNTLGNGIYDEFRIYNTALTHAEVLYLSQNAPEVSAGVSGDFNGNGVVDAADYVLWRNGGPLQNDPTPGVQAADYDFWRSRLGAISGSGSSVPEPATLVVVLCGLTASGGLIRRNR